MEFDVIPITGTQAGRMNAEQMKLLRTAQQKKNALIRSAEKELKEFEISLMGKGMQYSSLVESKRAELDSEVKYQCSVIADNLLFEISVIDQNKDTVTGSGDLTSTQVGYVVDYSLSYSERYKIVRDYYLKIKDVTERMTKYAADLTAKKYLDSYYKTLYNVLATYEK